MTAGHGVSHSEFAVLPDSDGRRAAAACSAGSSSGWRCLTRERHRAPAFEQHRDLPGVTGAGFTATVMVGGFAGAVSPATMYSPIVGADVSLRRRRGPAAGRRTLNTAVLVLDGGLTLDGQDVPPGPLGYLGTGRTAASAAGAARHPVPPASAASRSRRNC